MRAHQRAGGGVGRAGGGRSYERAIVKKNRVSGRPHCTIRHHRCVHGRSDRRPHAQCCTGGRRGGIRPSSSAGRGVQAAAVAKRGKRSSGRSTRSARAAPSTLVHSGERTLSTGFHAGGPSDPVLLCPAPPATLVVPTLMLELIPADVTGNALVLARRACGRRSYACMIGAQASALLSFYEKTDPPVPRAAETRQRVCWDGMCRGGRSDGSCDRGTGADCRVSVRAGPWDAHGI